jgi:hypothetical protein
MSKRSDSLPLCRRVPHFIAALTGRKISRLPQMPIAQELTVIISKHLL